MEVLVEGVKVWLEDGVVELGGVGYVGEVVVGDDEGMVVVVVYIIEEGERVGGGKVVVGRVENRWVGIWGVIGGWNVGKVGFEGDNDGVVWEIERVDVMGGDGDYEGVGGWRG